MIQTFSASKDKPHIYPFLKPAQTGEGMKKYLDYEPIEFSISSDGKKWTSEFDVPDLENIYCYSAPGVQPAVPVDNLRKVALQDGSRLLSTSYSERDLTMKLISYGNYSESDVMLGYDALQRFLVSRSPYWICFANWPQRMYYVKAKMSEPTYSSITGWSVEVTLTDLIGLSRSIGTSLDYEGRVIGFGNNEPVETPKYTFNVGGNGSFTVLNPSEVLIGPERRGHDFVMTLDGSSSGNMKIHNKTTDDIVSRTGIEHDTGGKKTFDKSDFQGKFVLNGVRLTLNGKSDRMASNGVMTLQKGPNQIEISNFSGKVTFDFPFWWLS